MVRFWIGLLVLHQFVVCAIICFLYGICFRIFLAILISLAFLGVLVPILILVTIFKILWYSDLLNRLFGYLTSVTFMVSFGLAAGVLAYLCQALAFLGDRSRLTLIRWLYILILTMRLLGQFHLLLWNSKFLFFSSWAFLIGLSLLNHKI